MYPFPPAADLQFLVGEEFGQIALDPHTIQFRFANGGQITTEWQIEHVDEDARVHLNDCVTSTGAAIYLQKLLQHRIVKVEAESLCLSLTFDSGAHLRIFSREGPYECGQIATKDRFIVF
jgi:hypothetical protein